MQTFQTVWVFFKVAITPCYYSPTICSVFCCMSFHFFPHLKCKTSWQVQVTSIISSFQTLYLTTRRDMIHTLACPWLINKNIRSSVLLKATSWQPMEMLRPFRPDQLHKYINYFNYSYKNIYPPYIGILWASFVPSFGKMSTPSL